MADARERVKAAQDSAASQHESDEKRVHQAERAQRDLLKRLEDAESSKTKCARPCSTQPRPLAHGVFHAPRVSLPSRLAAHPIEKFHKIETHARRGLKAMQDKHDKAKADALRQAEAEASAKLAKAVKEARAEGEAAVRPELTAAQVCSPRDLDEISRRSPRDLHEVVAHFAFAAPRAVTAVTVAASSP